MDNEKVNVATTLNVNDYRLLKIVAENDRRSISAYLRNLILDDFEKKNVQLKLKRSVKNGIKFESN